MDYWFSKYNRVLLPYSVSIAAAAAATAYIHLSAEAAVVYIQGCFLSRSRSHCGISSK
jgi:hypothetical protein